MKKREFERLLEGVEGFSQPKLSMEQYVTPAPVAAQMLHLAYMFGDLEGVVYDLGCGTGILSIGASLLGAQVVGIDIDMDALILAKENARRYGVDVNFLKTDISLVPYLFSERGTVLMNPPFGAQRYVRGNDRRFLRAAMGIGDVIYSIHNEGSKSFVENFVKPYRITHSYVMEYPMKKTYGHHTKELCWMTVEMFRMIKGGDTD